MPKPEGYIDLNRQFSLRENDDNADALAETSCDALSWLHRRSLIGWTKLIDSKGVAIVLGEPGSGRTWEFRARAQKLSEEGRPSFFVQLQHLIDHKLVELLDTEDSKPFQIWKQGSEQATFFLDAVDEAKLRSISDFEAALRNFRTSLGANALGRSRVLISCRVHQWDHVADSERIKTYLHLPEEELIPPETDLDDADEYEAKTSKVQTSKWLQVWILQPLDRERIAQYAKHKRISNVDGFLEALGKHHCWDFAGRPYDVDFLLGYWERYKRLNSLASMLDELVESQLHETKLENVKNQPLAKEKARAGAESLAAASVLCRRLDFFPPSVHHSIDSSALEIARCLSGDWTDAEIGALVDRPIFNAPSFGRIRFQHRRTTEYLAACWVRRLMSESSVAELKNLLFAEHRGLLAVRESRAPLAAWLAGLSEQPWALELRRLLLRSSPHVFFRYGDPSGLPQSYKESIINAFVTRHEHRDALRTRSDAGSLSRLADETMARVLNEHLRSPALLPGVKIELLRMATYGRVTGCVPAALELVTSHTNRGDLPGYAMWVIQECADRSQKQELARMLDSFESLSPAFAGELCQTLFPEVISISELEALVKKTIERPRLESTLGYAVNQSFATLSHKEPRISALAMCLRLLSQEPYLPETAVSSRFIWLGECIPPLLLRILEEPILNADETTVAAKAVWLCKDRHFRSELVICDDESGKMDLDKLTRRHPDVRQQSFWLDIEAEGRKPHRNRDPQWQGRWSFGSHLEFQATMADLDWMLTDLREKESPADREVVFHLYYACWVGLGGKRPELKCIRELIKYDRKLAAVLRGNLWTLRFSLWHRFWSYQKSQGIFNKWYWKHQKMRLERFRETVTEHCRLHVGIRHIRSGSAVGWLGYLINQSIGSGSRITVRNWGKLQKLYGRRIPWLGRRIVSATQQGCIKLWETYCPDPTRRTNGGEIGIVGIQFLHDTGKLRFDKIDADTARKAACYATQEINDFPEWFDELAEHHPGVVRSVLMECLKKEWALEGGKECYPDFMSRLSRDSCHHAPLVASELILMLKAGDPPNNRVLEHVLLLIVRHGNVTVSEWSVLAASRIVLYKEDDSQHRLWLALWIQADAQAAMTFLEETLPPPECADPMANSVVLLCAGMLRDIQPIPTLPSADYRNPSHAERFIRLVYRYVKPENDLRHVGGYSPVARDDAQHFRGNLITPLASRNERDIDEILARLADAPELSDIRDYILHTMDERAERMADAQAWSEEEFRAFAKDREVLPGNLDDLFHVVLRRIEGIKHDVEDAEESIRDEMNASRNEAGLQSFLVRKLRERNNQRYTAPKEPQIDGEERPDIQIHRSGIAGHVQIEVKLGDMKARSINSLKTDLEHQLLGQYMRDQHSTHGIFVVGFAGDGRRSTWNDPETGNEVGFRDVIDLLQARAMQLESGEEANKKIRVVGIDFGERQ